MRRSADLDDAPPCCFKVGSKRPICCGNVFDTSPAASRDRVATGGAPLRTVDVAGKARTCRPSVGTPLGRAVDGRWQDLHEAELGEELHLIEKQMLRGELVAASLVR